MARSGSHRYLLQPRYVHVLLMCPKMVPQGADQAESTTVQVMTRLARIAIQRLFVRDTTTFVLGLLKKLRSIGPFDGPPPSCAVLSGATSLSSLVRDKF